MRILSLDLGTKSVGVCISDELNIIAVPLKNFFFEENDFAAALKIIEQIVSEYSIGTIILGHPLRISGEKSQITLIIEDFFKELKSKFIDIKIKLYDERFTTQRGVELLKQKYKDPKMVEQYKDMASAYVMLTDYLTYNESGDDNG